MTELIRNEKLQPDTVDEIAAASVSASRVSASNSNPGGTRGSGDGSPA